MKGFKWMSMDIANSSSSYQSEDSGLPGSNTDLELTQYIIMIAAAKQYSGDSGVQFWLENKQLYPVIGSFWYPHLPTRAYVEHAFSVYSFLTSGGRNGLTKNLETRCFLQMNSKYYA